MDTTTHDNPKWRAVRTALIVTVSVFIVTSLFRLTEAGSLTPTAGPASSSETFEQLYDALTSTSFDSSGLTGNKNGSALQITKCIIRKMNGTPCP